METIITLPALKTILHKNRTLLNTWFALEKQQNNALNSDVFAHYFIHITQNIMKNFQDDNEPLLEEMILTLYKNILYLCAKGFLGQKGKHPFFEEVFISICLKYPTFIYHFAKDFIPKLGNTIINLCHLLKNKVVEWCQLMIAFHKNIKDTATFFEIAFISAWINGLAHYRNHSLELLNLIDEKKFSSLFNLPPIEIKKKNYILKQMKMNPWLTPQNLLEDNNLTTAHLKNIGNYKALGGFFTKEPQVFLYQNKLMVKQNEIIYQLFADVYGASLIKETLDLKTTNNKIKSPIILTDSGELLFNQQKVNINKKLLFPISSYTYHHFTYCFTSIHSYKVFIIGINPGEKLA